MTVLDISPTAQQETPVADTETAAYAADKNDKSARNLSPGSFITAA